MASIGGRDAFMMKPDLSLRVGNRAAFVLDAKWKHIDAHREDPKHGIDQDDMYQLYAYAKAYECNLAALVYPRNRSLQSTAALPLFRRLRTDLLAL